MPRFDPPIRVIAAALVLAPTTAGLLAADTRLTLAPFHGNGMVVQRDQPIVIVGRTAPGGKVTADFSGTEAEAAADTGGRFTLRLPARPACAEGGRLVIASGADSITIDDVVVGDVWLCTGQSNMEFDFNRLHTADEVRAEQQPLIRRIKFTPAFQPLPVDPVEVAVATGWQAATPETVPGWTATGYWFARAIHDRHPDVPIGLLECAYSGAPIEPWIPMETWADWPAFREGAEVEARRREPATAMPTGQEAWRMPSGMYNAMLSPLPALPITGAIWYQGESNVGQPDYADKLRALVAGWRKAWGREFPFYYVQLAGFMRNADDAAVRTEWALTRDLQRRALAAIPGSGMATAFDVGDKDDIHPKNKRDVGERLARWALRDVYGDATVVVSGPLVRDVAYEGGRARIRFDHVAGGLMAATKEGAAAPRPLAGEAVGGFAVGDGRGRWAWADAVIEDDSVVVSAAGIDSPQAVRYGMTNEPGAANLYNRAGLPASPFSTEP